MDFTKIFDFAGELPDGAKYAAALFAVLILFFIVVWLLKKITTKVRIGGRRGGRLKVQESIMVDASRTLTLVRCDNMEHLILLGGTNDLVVASNIQKSQSTVKNAPLTVALAPTVTSPAPQPAVAQASQPVVPQPGPAAPAHQEHVVQSHQQPQQQPQQQHPANSIPIPQPTHYRPPQQASNQPLPTPSPRANPSASTPPPPANASRQEPEPAPQPVQADMEQANTEGNSGAENANSPSLSNIRPGDEK